MRMNFAKGGGNETLVVGKLKGSAEGESVDVAGKILRKKEIEDYED
jgi:hypothetical protein